MYSDVPGGTPPYEYTPGSDQCGSGGGGVEGDCYSREHSFPKSWFNDNSPMTTDIFHVVPADQYVNNHRSNYPYGVVNAPSWTSLNGSKVGPCAAAGYTGTVFEPIDAYKGDFARIYFYMATRYQNLIASWPSNDPNADAVLNGTSFPAYESWFLDLLIQWHTQDPVSAKEIARNDSVWLIQENRNPYVDHPEYVAMVWLNTAPVPEPTNHVTGFTAAAGFPPYNTIQLTWTDASGSVIPGGYLIRGSAVGYGSIVSPTDGVVVTSGGLDKNIAPGVQSCTFTGLDASTPYYFKIFPYTNTGVNIDYKTSEPVPTAGFTTATGISQMQPGDIAIIEFASVNPDKFSFVTFTQLNAGTVISFTDNGFTDPSTVRTGEGFLVYTAPSIIPAGTVVSWYYGMNISGTGWNSSSPSNFAFNESGDQVFAYQGTWGSGQTLICGLNAGNAGWLTSGTTASTTSYFPAGLTDEVNAMTFPEKNGYYNLITAGTIHALGSLCVNSPNWTRSVSTLPTPAWSFSITTETIISQPATVLNMVVGAGEKLTISPGIQLLVTGDLEVAGED
jgi:endonuclease I